MHWLRSPLRFISHGPCINSVFEMEEILNSKLYNIYVNNLERFLYPPSSQSMTEQQRQLFAKEEPLLLSAKVGSHISTLQTLAQKSL